MAVQRRPSLQSLWRDRPPSHAAVGAHRQHGSHVHWLRRAATEYRLLSRRAGDDGPASEHAARRHRCSAHDAARRHRRTTHAWADRAWFRRRQSAAHDESPRPDGRAMAYFTAWTRHHGTNAVDSAGPDRPDACGWTRPDGRVESPGLARRSRRILALASTRRHGWPRPPRSAGRRRLLARPRSPRSAPVSVYHFVARSTRCVVPKRAACYTPRQRGRDHSAVNPAHATHLRASARPITLRPRLHHLLVETRD